MSQPLTLSDFPRFFEAVRGQRPFPWQQRLVRTVADRGRWPGLLNLPTGSGKTAVLDIAAFLLALGSRGVCARQPRRTALVVDRRIVVDQAASAGGALERALLEPRDPIVAAVADALRDLSGTDVPLVTATLRGGIVRDEGWSRRPDVPALLAATVDQIGSRLLFRGYGVSDALRPIHAGLLGCDTLILLDEVHLSQPFADTLREIRARHRAPEEELLPAGWQVVEMSATPGAAVGDTFDLEPATDLDPLASPVLHRRVTASKPVTLRRVAGRNRSALAQDCAKTAAELLLGDGARTLAVVVNRVDTAHLVSSELRERLGIPTLLLTGRMRPFDRDDLLEGHRDRLRTGRHPRDDGTKLVVVGTQCIEAGADFDFDALVTECASLDALRQRFGRLDRDGQRGAAGTPSRGVILALDGALGGDPPDPVYGGALAATWTWLSQIPDPDLGVSRLELPGGRALDVLLAPRERAPILFPAHLDAWAQTWPTREPDPDVALWLHGLRPPSTDVHVVWRADLDRELLTRHREAAVALVQACPPASGEAVAVPIGAVRRWLVGAPAAEVADVDGIAMEETPEGAADPRPFIRWRGDESRVFPTPTALAPGEVLIVPSSYGGLSEGSWSPQATDPVADLGHRGQLGRRRVVVRLIPPLCGSIAVPDPDDEEIDPVEAVWEWLSVHADDLVDRGVREAARLLRLQGRRRLRVQRLLGPDGSSNGARGYLVCSAFVVVRESAEMLDGEETSEPATSPFAGPREVPLDRHLRGVSAIAAQMAAACGLPPRLVGDLRLAGALHDVGKLDPRFQRWLRAGDELTAVLDDEPLAKSGIPAGDRARREDARRRSGYPRGARHELLSMALVEGRDDILARAGDPDLVLHLIASHHGFGRPFVPVAADPRPERVSAHALDEEFRGTTAHGLERLDSGIPERFWRLVERYGRFGLAWLEAIVRLADHRESELEQIEEGA